MKQILEFLPIVLFFGAYQMDGETLTVGAWSHTFDGIFSATAVLMIATIGVWLVMLAVTRRNDKRLMDDGGGRHFWNGNFSTARSTIHSMETDSL